MKKESPEWVLNQRAKLKNALADLRFEAIRFAKKNGCFSYSKDIFLHFEELQNSEGYDTRVNLETRLGVYMLSNAYEYAEIRLKSNSHMKDIDKFCLHVFKVVCEFY